MSAIREICSVCGVEFDVVFRYQMEERDGGFAFFCSQACLSKSCDAADRDGEAAVVCDGCAKRFSVSLASQVLYIRGRRRYACSMACRSQIVREASGARLGQIAAEPDERLPEASPPEARPSEVRPGSAAASASASLPASAPTATAKRADRPVSSSASRTGSRLGSPLLSVRKGGGGEPGGLGPPRPPRRIAVFNHKGGTGKTTTSVSLAGGLAARGKRVLLVDTDSQGNVAVSLGARSERSLYHVLVMGLRVSDATQTVRPGLDLLPSNETLAAAELYLAGRQNRDRVLSERMASAADGYDYAIIDCSPSLSLMNQNALVFADSVLVPVCCDYLSLVGVRQVIKTVRNVNALLHHRLQIWGVLPTFFDVRAKICSEALQTLRDHFGERCLPPIRATTRLKEAPARAKTIFEYAPGAHGSADYELLVDRILGGEPQGQHEAAASPRPETAAMPSIPLGA